MSRWRVTIPWPSGVLSPNCRKHWRALAAHKKEYRGIAYALAKHANSSTMPSDKPWVLCLDFYPPDKRRRDVDNLLASLKSALDGICDAWGIDDSRFRMIILRMEAPIKGGKVVVKTRIGVDDYPHAQ